MSKELEAFRDILGILSAVSGCEVDMNSERIISVKSALQRLESIDNSKPSEALEKLLDGYSKGMAGRSYYDTIKQALLKAQEQEKVLEIIKEKKVNIDLLYASSSVEQYNDELVRVYGMWFVKDRQLTQDEFDTLKEVLCDE